MNIYVDESGSFVSPAARGSWSVVVALATTEAARRVIERAVLSVRSAVRSGAREIKLHELTRYSFGVLAMAPKHHDKSWLKAEILEQFLGKMTQHCLDVRRIWPHLNNRHLGVRVWHYTVDTQQVGCTVRP
jgi:hypothetical protein